MEAAYEALATEEAGVSPFDEPAYNVGPDELQEIHSVDSFPTQTLNQEEDHAAVDDGDDGTPQLMPQFEELLDDHTDGVRGRSLLRVLYCSSFLSAWGDRMWGFAVPLLLTSIFKDSLLPASAFPFATQLACVIFGTWMGRMVDEVDRKKIITYSLMVQNGCVMICAVFLYLLLPFEAPHPPLSDWRFLSVFFSLVAVGSVAALASMAEDIAVGRDWVVVLTSGDQGALTDANAMVTRISLFCKVAAPVAFSLVMSITSTTGSLIFVCMWNAVSILPELFSLLHIYNEVPGLQKKVAVRQSHGNAFSTLWAGWRAYIASRRTFLASFAYALLFWTALSPGALMSAYLLTHGINEIYIALYMGVSSVIGMIPTFFTARLFKRFGIEQTGLYAIWSQDVCLLVGVVFFLVPNMVQFGRLIADGHLTLASALSALFLQEAEGHTNAYASSWSLWVFLLCLILSRIGLWTFDLAERQLMQEYVPAESRGVINSVEYSLTNIFSLFSFAMGIVFFKPEQFGVLVVISFGAVTAAALCYSRWLRTAGGSPHPQLAHLDAA